MFLLLQNPTGQSGIRQITQLESKNMEMRLTHLDVLTPGPIRSKLFKARVTNVAFIYLLSDNAATKLHWLRQVCSVLVARNFNVVLLTWCKWIHKLIWSEKKKYKWCSYISIYVMKIHFSQHDEGTYESTLCSHA